MRILGLIAILILCFIGYKSFNTDKDSNDRNHDEYKKKDLVNKAADVMSGLVFSKSAKADKSKDSNKFIPLFKNFKSILNSNQIKLLEELMVVYQKTTKDDISYFKESCEMLSHDVKNCNFLKHKSDECPSLSKEILNFTDQMTPDSFLTVTFSSLMRSANLDQDLLYFDLIVEYDNSKDGQKNKRFRDSQVANAAIETFNAN